LPDLAIGEPKPASQRSCVLVYGRCGDQAARAHIVGLIGTDNRVLPVHVLTLDRAADDEMVTSPPVVGAIAIAGESATEIGSREGGDLVAQAGCGHHSIKILKALAELREQPRMLHSLIVVRVKAA